MAAVLQSWRFDPWIALASLMTAMFYLRGWLKLQPQMPERFPPWRAVAFVGGIAAVYVAIASPIDAFAGLLLQVHMVQHLLLLTVAPPLLLLGAPIVPLLRGLPNALAKGALGPFLAAPEMKRLGRTISHPLAGLLSITAATWIWHAPAPYQLALRSSAWHQVEHVTFLAAGLLYWWPVVQPWPSRPILRRWAVPLYLLIADVQNTALAAILVFSERLLYPMYATVPRLGQISAETDQIAAGALMWVTMSLCYLVPAAIIIVRLLSPSPRVPGNVGAPSLLELLETPQTKLARSAAARATRSISPRSVKADLLAFPHLGRLLRSRSARRILQVAMFFLGLGVVADGLVGPQVSAMNLAGVLPWTYWRAFTVIALLAVGNVFCMACPFTLPRDLARRIGFGKWSWPRALRTKWIAIALLTSFFCAYEATSLWASPRATAGFILLYFVAAFVIDATFRGASFCKYVCPIGQFQFVQSLLSPFEVKVRQPSVCGTCTTHDCLQGGERGRGCETELFLPRKHGSLDCTFCLDCARACPHDNVGVIAVTPGRTIWSDPELSSLGKLSRRMDVGVLALALVAASLVTAAAMVEPVVAWLDASGIRLGFESTKPITILAITAGIVIVPTLLFGLGSVLASALSSNAAEARTIFCRFALALVPLGASMWTAHFLFHLLSGWNSVVPPVQHLIGSDRILTASTPLLRADTMLRLQVLLLDVGLVYALYCAWKVAGAYAARTRATLALWLPFALFAVTFYAGAVWVFLQPMEMRGMIH